MSLLLDLATLFTKLTHLLQRRILFLGRLHRAILAILTWAAVLLDRRVWLVWRGV